MPFRPAETIRAYLDEHDGETSVPFHNLLTTWRLDEADETERRRIEQELAEAGVVAEPGLADLGPDDELTLRVAPGPPEEAPAGPPLEPEAEAPPPVPWQAELDAAVAGSNPQPGGSRPRPRIPRWGWSARRDLGALALVLLSGVAAAALGYVLGKAF